MAIFSSVYSADIVVVGERLSCVQSFSLRYPSLDVSSGGESEVSSSNSRRLSLTEAPSWYTLAQEKMNDNTARLLSHRHTRDRQCNQASSPPLSALIHSFAGAQYIGAMASCQVVKEILPPQL